MVQVALTLIFTDFEIRCLQENRSKVKLVKMKILQKIIQDGAKTEEADDCEERERKKKTMMESQTGIKKYQISNLIHLGNK